jgi:hypothetical protein
MHPSLQLTLLLAAAGLAACLPSKAVSTPAEVVPATQPAPSPLPEDPTPRYAPLTAATPPIVLEPPIAQPTITPTPPQVGLPLEVVAILSPGPGSQVTSPIYVRGFGGPSFNQRVHFRLYGEDGRLLSQATTYLFSYPGNPGRFIATLPFLMDLVAEEGRLEVSIDSLRDGQRTHLSTVALVLLSAGSAHIYPAPHGAEKLTVFSPRPNQHLTGGRVTIEGAGWAESDLPLVAEVLDRQGASLGRAEFRLTSDEPGELGTFRVEVPYQVDRYQPGKVVVYELGKAIPGLVHYAAVDVTLAQ